MQQATAFDAVPNSNTPPRAIGVALRYLPTVVVILAACGLLATMSFDRPADAADVPRLVPAPSAAPISIPSRDPSLLDTSSVFSGREVEIEEPIPTF